MTSRVIILSFIILAVAFATNWITDRAPETVPEDLTKNDPDLYMLSARIMQFNGGLQRELSAERFTHFPLTDLTTLGAPNLVLFTDDGIPWSITAKHGRLLSKSTFREEVVELWDDVLAVKQDPDGRFINIQSQGLTVYPEREYAETAQKVYIDANSGRTTAAGMQAHFKEGRFVFFSAQPDRVHTIFLPAYKR